MLMTGLFLDSVGLALLFLRSLKKEGIGLDLQRRQLKTKKFTTVIAAISIARAQTSAELV